MKKNKKYILYIIGCLAAVLLFVNANYIRIVVSRHFESISSVDAIAQMEDALKKKYPDKSFERVSGEYMDNSGYYNDSYYTSSFIVDGQSDNRISVTCRDSGYKHMWDEKYSVFIDEEGYEKKTALVKRLCADYTQFLTEEVGLELREYATLGNISVESPFEQGSYNKELPDDIQYEMEFSPELDLEWEFKIIVQNHIQNEEEKTMKEIISMLGRNGFQFEKYQFIFIVDNERVYYEYDAREGSFSKKN